MNTELADSYKIVLVGIDRDDTLIYDRGFPGGEWPDEQLELKPGVAEGIRLLNQMVNAKCVMISNQSGPARGKVRSEVVAAVNQAIHQILMRREVKLQGMFYCEHVPRAYAHQHGLAPDNPFVKDCDDWKPKIGLLKKAATSFGTTLENAMVYTIGDRTDDVMTGINAGGKGVFVPGDDLEHSRDEEARRLEQIYAGRVYLARDFLDAATWILKDLKTHALSQYHHGLSKNSSKS